MGRGANQNQDVMRLTLVAAKMLGSFTNGLGGCKAGVTEAVSVSMKVICARPENEADVGMVGWLVQHPFKSFLSYLFWGRLVTVLQYSSLSSC